MNVECVDSNFSRAKLLTNRMTPYLVDTTAPRPRIKRTKMLSILRKARLKDKEMRILMLWVLFRWLALSPTDYGRGLDNAGKTTIVKKIMNEDVNSVSPTLGFIIKTIEYDG
jgi:hypothetical protein